MGKVTLNSQNHIKLTDEEMEVLSKYESIFERALKYSTLRGVSKMMSQEIAKIIDKNKQRHYNWGCGGCVIGLYKRAANIYNYNLELRAAEETEKPVINDLTEIIPDAVPVNIDEVVSDDAEEQKNEESKDGGKKRGRKKASKKQDTEIQSEA